MNVFVLCTGRCGSLTFSKAAAHATNYTASHEINRHLLGRVRFEYPGNHIAVDFRLAWLLGRLDVAWGQKAFYVHLIRDPEATAASFVKLAALDRPSADIQKRFDLPESLNHAGAPVWAHMHVQALKAAPIEIVAEDMVRNINSDIKMFLKDKEWMPVRLESAKEDFGLFWDRIGAQGDMDAALAEWDVRHHASEAA